MKLFSCAFFLFIGFLLIPNSSLLSKESSSENPFLLSTKEPVVLEADQLAHEKQFHLIIARGHVKLTHEDRVLYADTVSYNQKLNKVTAAGNIKIIEKTGEVVFLDYAELSDDLKQGFIRNVRMILEDEAKLAANSCKRQKGNTSTFNEVAYSPCKVCSLPSKKPPLWQLKARRVVWDETTEDIIYTDAWMEFMGVPVAYSPYLSHPAPTVKRRSGFLAPILGGSSNIGGLFGLPYYWAVNDQTGLTVTPTFVGKNMFMLGSEYNQRFSSGLFNLAGSLTKGRRVTGTNDHPITSASVYRWHILSDGRFNLTPHWRTGFKVEQASDQTYLRRFGHLGLSHKKILTSTGYLEGFYGNNYLSTHLYKFQGLRDQDRKSTTPLILPYAQASYVSEPLKWGSYINFDSNILGLTRSEGAKMGRLSAIGSWTVPYLSSWGEVYSFGARLKTEGYHVTSFRPTSTSNTTNTSLVQALPQAFATWRYPLVQRYENTRFIVEPLAGIVAAPNLARSYKIPAEDSRYIEFNDLNIMSSDRFAGLDRVDGGSRFNYGFNVFALRSKEKARLFFGQSAAFQEPRPYLAETGLDKRWSDYVGRLDISYEDWILASSRALLDRSGLKAKRHELIAALGKPLLRLHVDYIVLPKFVADPLDQGAKQVRFGLSSQFTENWLGEIHTTRELGSRGGSLAHGIGLTYQDECFTFSLTAQKLFYRDRDFKPGVEILARLVFKNLGEIRQGTSFGESEISKPQEVKVPGP